MNNIPKKLRAELAEETFYHYCARQDALHDHECQRDPMRPGQAVEWEHALVYAGKQVQKRFAIVPLCWYVHRGPGLNKEINVWIALNRASDDELLELSHKGGRDYFKYRFFLNSRFGVYPGENPGDNMRISGGKDVGIHYTSPQARPAF